MNKRIAVFALTITFSLTLTAGSVQSDQADTALKKTALILTEGKIRSLHDSSKYLYVGMEKCASVCHNNKEMGFQYDIMRLDPHANSFANLTSRKAAHYAGNAGIKGNPQESSICLKCHVTGGGLDSSSFAATYKKEDGVTCESCHKGEFIKKTFLPKETDCLKCHNESVHKIQKFNFTAECAKIAHPRPNHNAPPSDDKAGLKSFPGAEGWGAVTTGGRYGKVIKVTNLNTSGPGSLAEACATEGPRIVVFEVSGVINGDVFITEPYITIAGQTAPGAGITIEGMLGTYDFGVHDIIVRHLRMRRQRDIGSGGDAIQMGGLGPEKRGTYNIILDHLSLSWGNDEVIDLYNAHDITVQWCSVEESDDKGHDKGEHNYGIISAAENSGAVSAHHNLWANHSRRIPCMAPYRENAADDFCNNLIYNCRGGYTDDGHGNRAKSPVNLRNNYYRRGPQTIDRMYPYALSTYMNYYVKDNYFEDWEYQDHPKSWKPSNQPGGVPGWIQYNNNGGELSEPGQVPPITIQDAKEVYNLVLAKAGCWPRDRMTKRTIEDVKNKTGSWGRSAPLEPSDDWFMEGLSRSVPSTDTDGDGMPDTWEKAHGLDQRNPGDANMIVPPGSSKDNRHQGFTFIEFYINELADDLVK